VSGQLDEGLYHEVHIDWTVEFNQETPHLEIEVLNYDFYDLMVEKIQIDNITIFEEDFTIKKDNTSKLSIDDISEIYDTKNENITFQVYVDKAKFQPAYQAKINLDYNITEGNRIGYHRSYGVYIVIEHEIASQLPTWLEANREIDYNGIYSNRTGLYNYTLKTAIAKYFENNNTLIFAVQKEDSNGINTEAVRMSADYPVLVSWLNPSHIEIIKEKPTSFLNHLYSYQGEETINLDIGEFESYNIKKTQPYFVDGSEGEIWVEKNTGIILRSNTSYLEGVSEKRILVHTNILNNGNNGNIPAYPFGSLIIGISIIILIKIPNKINKS
jgi:hypothetical protein